MAHLWQHFDADGWQPVALHGDAYVLDTQTPRLSAAQMTGEPAAVAYTRLCRASAGADEDWALLAHPDAGILVNGRAASLGIVILANRDEIRMPEASPLYFSTERLAVAVPYPAGLQGFCPRCRTALGAGAMAVLCPACGLWHHATDDLPCWTYGERCAACAQPTALDAGFRWTPEDL